MTSLNLTLPETLADFVRDQAAKSGCQNSTEYVESLIRQEQHRHAQLALEAELLKGLNSGPSGEMTDEDWARLHRLVAERAGQRRAG